MALFEQSGAGEAFEEILERERVAILTGRFDILERLFAEKERLIGALRQRPLSSGHLSSLRGKAEKNSHLLAAMGRGIRAATRRIETLRTKSASLTTYDAAGQRLQIEIGDHSLHRRA